MDSPTGDLCRLFSLQRPLLDFEGACLCLWPRCYSGALIYGCSLFLSLFFCLVFIVSSALDSRCVLLEISTGASLS